MNLKVGETEFNVDDSLTKKLDLMCDRVIKPNPKLDAFLANSGYEGEGKTNASIIEAAYVKSKTNRPISLFFKTSTCLSFAQITEQQIIILDEPSFDLLSTDHSTQNAKDFLRLVSTMRKKRHFVILNFAKFWKFPEWLIVDRCLGMVHLYSKQGTDLGKFYYIRKKNLEELWNAYHKNHKRLYGKLKSFRGRLPYTMEDIFKDLDINVEGIPHASFDDYEREKDRAIASIGSKSKKEDKNLIKLRELQYKVTQLAKVNNLDMERTANVIGVSSRSMRLWAKSNTIEAFPLGNDAFSEETGQHTITGSNVKENDDTFKEDD